MIDALGSAILIATGNPPSAIAALGLQSSQAIAAGFSGLNLGSRAAISSVLDAIEAAPAAGPFSSLSSSAQQTELVQLLAPFQPPGPSASDVQALQDYYSQVSADNANVLTEIADGSIPDEIDVPSGPPPNDLPEVPLITFPPSVPPSSAQILAATTYVGLQLVSTPVTASAQTPPPPAEPAVSLGLAVSLIDWALGSVLGAVLPQSLVDQLAATFDSDDSDEEAPPVPPPTAPVLGGALATWILNA